MLIVSFSIDSVTLKKVSNKKKIKINGLTYGKIIVFP